MSFKYTEIIYFLIPRNKGAINPFIHPILPDENEVGRI